MLKTTRWKPDTCGCELEYEWDSDTTSETRTHTIKNVITACEIHKNIKDINTHYNTILTENQMKNNAIRLAIEGNSKLTKQILDPKGNSMTVIADGVKFDWSFDASRNLQVGVSGSKTLTTGEKSTLQTAIDTLYPGKVQVN